MPQSSPWQVVSESPATPQQVTRQPGADQWQVTNTTLAQPQPQTPDVGVKAGLKRFGSGIVHMPDAVFDAFTRPPQSMEEEQAANMLASGTDVQMIRQLSLGLHRLIAKPMEEEAEKADKYQKQATGSTDVPQFEPGFDFSVTGKTPQDKFQHLANMHRLASYVPMVGPLAGSLTERFMGVGDFEGKPDRSGAATELLANIAAPKIMEGTGKLGIAALNRAVGKVAPAVAERLYQSSLKPPATNAAAESLRMVRTGLDVGVPISEAGAARLSKLIGDLNDKIEAEIASNPNAPINKFKVASRLNAPAQRFAQQVAPTADLEHVSNVGQEFIESQPATITAEDAQALKKGTYKNIGDRGYGEAATARIEAEKALARGLKEELEQHFPEIKKLNAEEAKLIDLKGALERAVSRTTNRQTIPARLGGPTAGLIAGGVSDAIFGHQAGVGVGLATYVMKTVLDDPAMQSNLALAISKAGRGRVPYDVAHFRVQQFVNALGQSMNGQGEHDQR